VGASVFLANSHRWLYERLTECAVLEEGVTLAETRRGADVIVYPSPPWPDPEAGDRLATFGWRDLGRTSVFSQHDRAQPWAPGMYASLPASRARHGFTGGFYVAHHHREPDGLATHLEVARENEPQMLWSFTGTFSNALVRRRLAELSDPDGRVINTQYYSDVIRWHLTDTHRAEGSAAFASYAESLGRSAFVLCPRGYGPSSIRLFEAMQVGRCPVIISDEWLPPPFVDWSSCSIRVPEAGVEDIPVILRERQDEAAQLGYEARRVWERFFAPEHQLRTILRAAVTTERSMPGRLRDFGAWLTDPQTSLHASLHVMRRTSQRARRRARSAKSQTGVPER
jgi:Exostosin family